MRHLYAPVLIACAYGCSSECEEDTASCSEDGSTLTHCVDGKSVTDVCSDHGQLCEASACVDPWRYGSPSFTACAAGNPRKTPESLAEKAAYYDAIATRLHLHPSLGFVLNVTLPGADPATPAIAESVATYQDVAQWQSGENDGLWSALYLTSQAYRYAVTRSAEALATIKTLLDGEVIRMRITGVRGVFTRQYIPPNVPGIACPTDLAAYQVDVEKDDNQWVQIREDGCAWVVRDGAFVKTDHCGLPEFGGWCWLDNVSKDEYAGHLFALGAILHLVDDPEALAIARDLMAQVTEHLIANHMKVVDWDGRPTEHGRFTPFTFDDFPGFSSAMALEVFSIARALPDHPEVGTFMDECLLQSKGEVDCLGSGLIDNEPYTVFLPNSGMYVGPEGCRSNFNNISMHMLSLHHLIWNAQDPKLKAAAQMTFDEDVVRSDSPRAVQHQKNAFFDLLWAGQKRLGPGSDGPAYAAVDEAVCLLEEMQASLSTPEITTFPPEVQPYCDNRFDTPVSQVPRTISYRCPGTFVWWGDPYGLGTCTLDRRQVNQPSGYLLPYWIGRYYGFIGENL